jgi:hypothetical protein
MHGQMNSVRIHTFCCFKVPPLIKSERILCLQECSEFLIHLCSRETI